MMVYSKRLPGGFMEQIESILMKVNDLVWGPVMLMLLLGTHIFLTFRLGWIQRFVFKGIRLSVERKKDGGGDGDISQFGALMTNALMAIPNLISLILLSGVIAAETRHYFSNEKKGEGIGNVSVKDAKVVETGNTSGA